MHKANMARNKAVEKTNPKEKQSSKLSAFITKLSKSFKENRFLSASVKVARVILFIVGLYLVLMPVLPYVYFYIRQITGKFDYPEQEISGSMTTGGDGSGGNGTQTIPSDNRLVISSIGVNIQVVEGSSAEALDRGAWRRPNTSTPDRGGNTVITGHRFKYLPPNNLTFYNLDKVKEGDKIIVYWQGIEYDYYVTEIFEVDPSQTEVEENTAQPRLTLYTCTPLWTAERRLVIVAEPKTENNENTGVI